MSDAYKPAWIRWYEADFWSDRDVLAMTPLQRHLYRALILQASQCDTRPYLPNDEWKLGLLADTPTFDIWQKNRDIVMSKFTLTEHGWENKRASEEYAYCKMRSECSAANLPRRSPPGFDAFWLAYPRRVAKGMAAKVWAKLQPDAELQAKILAAIEIQRRSEQWQRDGGQFIPHPATWLNQARWEDEPEIQGVRPAPAAIDPSTFEWKK